MKLDPLQLNPALLNNKSVPELDMKRIDETARDFEAMFMTEMMRPMFEGLGVNEMFGGGKGEETFKSMLLDEYGKDLAATNSLGIADLVKQQLIEMQSKADQPEMARNMHNQSVALAATTGERKDVQ